MGRRGEGEKAIGDRGEEDRRGRGGEKGVHIERKGAARGSVLFPR